MDMNNYTYDGKFEGNILVLGQAACGKITFIQNLARIKLFGQIKDVTWLTKITLSKKEKIIQDRALTFELIWLICKIHRNLII